MRKSATGFFEYPLVLIVILTMSMRHTDAQSFEFNYNRDFKKILSETNDPANNLYYEKLVQRFKSNDTTFTNYQILALLIGFTDNVHFKPYDYLSIERRIYSLNGDGKYRSEEHTSELQSHSDLVCRLLLEKKKNNHSQCCIERSLRFGHSITDAASVLRPT